MTIINYAKKSIMDLSQFIVKFAAQFDHTNADSFTSETRFKEIDEWSSLYALFIVGMIDEEYSVMITGDEMRNSKTIQDLYEIVNSKLGFN